MCTCITKFCPNPLTVGMLILFKLNDLLCSFTVFSVICVGSHSQNNNSWLTCGHFRCLDLREDKFYLADHPGLVPVTTSQVIFSLCNMLRKGK